jgi:hypothetical protein
VIRKRRLDDLHEMTSWIEGQTKLPAPRAKEVARNST